MGREIRRVPPNWKHPVTKDNYGRDRLQPMYKGSFADAEAEWLGTFDRIRSGDMTDSEREYYPHGVCQWAQDETPPNPDYYCTWPDDEATWFQVWETVSEGTPVSPPFETQEELIEHLAAHGDDWDQSRGDPAWGRERAERFVRAGWAPSFVMIGGQLLAGTAAS